MIVAKDALVLLCEKAKSNYPLSTPFCTSFIFLISKCTLGQNWIVGRLRRGAAIYRILVLFPMVTLFVAVLEVQVNQWCHFQSAQRVIGSNHLV